MNVSKMKSATLPRTSKSRSSSKSKNRQDKDQNNVSDSKTGGKQRPQSPIVTKLQNQTKEVAKSKKKKNRPSSQSRSPSPTTNRPSSSRPRPNSPTATTSAAPSFGGSQQDYTSTDGNDLLQNALKLNPSLAYTQWFPKLQKMRKTYLGSRIPATTSDLEPVPGTRDFVKSSSAQEADVNENDSLQIESESQTEAEKVSEVIVSADQESQVICRDFGDDKQVDCYMVPNNRLKELRDNLNSTSASELGKSLENILTDLSSKGKTLPNLLSPKAWKSQKLICPIGEGDLNHLKSLSTEVDQAQVIQNFLSLPASDRTASILGDAAKEVTYVFKVKESLTNASEAVVVLMNALFREEAVSEDLLKILAASELFQKLVTPESRSQALLKASQRLQEACDQIRQCTKSSQPLDQLQDHRNLNRVIVTTIPSAGLVNHVVNTGDYKIKLSFLGNSDRISSLMASSRSKSAPTKLPLNQHIETIHRCFSYIIGRLTAVKYLLNQSTRGLGLVVHEYTDGKHGHYSKSLKRSTERLRGLHVFSGIVSQISLGFVHVFKRFENSLQLLKCLESVLSPLLLPQPEQDQSQAVEVETNEALQQTSKLLAELDELTCLTYNSAACVLKTNTWEENKELKLEGVKMKKQLKKIVDEMAAAVQQLGSKQEVDFGAIYMASMWSSAVLVKEGASEIPKVDTWILQNISANAAKIEKLVDSILKVSNRINFVSTYLASKTLANLRANKERQMVQDGRRKKGSSMSWLRRTFSRQSGPGDGSTSSNLSLSILKVREDIGGNEVSGYEKSDSVTIDAELNC